MNQISQGNHLRRLSAVVLGLLVLGLGAGSAFAESLRGAVEKAILNHPRSLSAQWNAEAVRERSKVVSGRMLPQVGIEGYIGPEYRDRSVVGVDTDGFQAARQGSAVVRQLLWDGFLTPNQAKAAKLRAEGAEALEDDVREELALSVVEAYFGVLRAREQVSLAQRNVTTHEDALAKTVARVEGGRGQGADVELVEGRLGLARASLETRRTLLKNAGIRYRQLVGEDPQSLSWPKAVSDSRLPNSVAGADLRGNFASQAAQLNYEAARKDEEAMVGLRLPRFDLEVRGSVGEDLGGIKGADNQFSAFFVGRWDLYTGGSILAQGRESTARANQAAGIVGDAERIAEEQLGSAIADRQGAGARTLALDEYADSISGVVNAYEQQFEIGARALLSVLDVKNEEFRARSALADSRYARILAEYRMLQSMGTLVTTVTGQTDYNMQMARRARLKEVGHEDVDVEVITYTDDGPYEKKKFLGIFGRGRRKGSIDDQGNETMHTVTPSHEGELGGNEVIYVEWEEGDETGGNKIEYEESGGLFGGSKVQYEEADVEQIEAPRR